MQDKHPPEENNNPNTPMNTFEKAQVTGSFNERHAEHQNARRQNEKIQNHEGFPATLRETDTFTQSDTDDKAWTGNKVD